MRSWHWIGCWSCRSEPFDFALMRLWSFHPEYLDAKGLVALWRETLLAQAVLRGRTRGYTNHPQLIRFRAHRAPVAAIATYLEVVFQVGNSRGYHFDRSRIAAHRPVEMISVTSSQLEYEWHRLLDKLKQRDPEHWRRIESMKMVKPHSLFRVAAGTIEPWEKIPREADRYAGAGSLSTLNGSGGMAR